MCMFYRSVRYQSVYCTPMSVVVFVSEWRHPPVAASTNSAVGVSVVVEQLFCLRSSVQPYALRVSQLRPVCSSLYWNFNSNSILLMYGVQKTRKPDNKLLLQHLLPTFHCKGFIRESAELNSSTFWPFSNKVSYDATTHIIILYLTVIRYLQVQFITKIFSITFT